MVSPVDPCDSCELRDADADVDEDDDDDDDDDSVTVAVVVLVLADSIKATDADVVVLEPIHRISINISIIPHNEGNHPVWRKV